MLLQKRSFRRAQVRITWAALCAGAASAPALAQTAPGIVGQNGWLYYRNELSTPADDAAVDATIDQIARTNRVLAANGIQLVVAMSPLKVRVHPENLPADVKLDTHLSQQYQRIQQRLRAAGIKTADVNTAFMASPQRTQPMPLYFMRDTHWSSAGALLAAQTVARTVQEDPALKSIWEAAPKVGYTLTWSPRDWPIDGDLKGQLPKGAPTYDKEMIKVFEVTRDPQAPSGGLLGQAAPAITLLGSSYTADWTNFPAAMRYALQRDVLSISVDALRGQWVGLQVYLRDDAFQTSRPKMLIWEMPERDMRAPSDFQYRENRYRMNRTEWVLRTAALIQAQCTPAKTAARVQAATIAGASGTANGFSASNSTADGFIEIGLDAPLDRLDYLSGKLVLSGSRNLVVEASGPGVATRRINAEVHGDDSEHEFRLPIVSEDGSRAGFTRLRLYPGTTSTFTMNDLQLCRQPADLLN